MKNFLQVNRALRAKKNFNFNFKSLLVLMIVLIAASSQAWGTELVDIDLSSWSTQTVSAGSSVDGYYFKSAATITNGSGWVKTANATNSSNYIGIPLSGINGSVTITVTHYSGRPSIGYDLVTGNSAYNADYSHSSSLTNIRINPNGTTTAFVISNLSGSYGHLILGATGNATNNTFFISNITVTTPTTQPSTSADTPGASGTVTFEDWTGLTKQTCYWKDGIKFYQRWTSTSISASNDYCMLGYKVPGYQSNMIAGGNWGGHSMSGLLTYAHNAFAVSITTPSTIEVTLDNNQNNDLTLASLFIVKDNVAYNTPYADGTYSNGTDIKSRATITRLVDNKGKYKVSISVDASDLSNTNPYIVKFGNTGTGSQLFVYESVTVTPIVSCTDPGAATGLSRTSATGTTMTLGWTDGSNADSYKVSLFTDAECTEAATSTEGNDYAVNTNSVTYTGLSLNSTYYFKVQSVGDGSSYCEDGPWSSASGAVKTGVCNDYSFHYGTENADDWTTTCFTQVGSTSEWEVTDFTIPNKPNWYVGKYGFFYNDGMNYENAKSHTDAWSDLFFAASQGNGSGTRPKVGAATGATGRIRIYNNSSWNNLFASFEPDGYKLKFGSSTYADFEADGSVANCYWSPLMTYSSSTAGDKVGVGIIDASSNYVSTNNTQEMQHIFLHVGNNTSLWGMGGVTNFGLWDDTNKSFTCLMTKVPGEDYIYEGWIPSSCDHIIFVRLKSSTLAWGDGNSNIYNQTGSWMIPANTNMFTISEWSSGSWSAYSRTGKFRMWDNSTEKNWYVHFYPHNVLTYDGNGGSGSMTPQSVKADAADQELTVAGNGFTREGWTFTGWNTEKHGKGAAYAAGDGIDVTEDITLYAQWERTVYLKSDLSWWYNKNGDDDAWFSIYYWDSYADSNKGWVEMELADCETNVYKATLPGNGYNNIIFVRKTTNQDLSWTGVDNQSVDVAYPTTNPKYTITSTSDSKVTGSWGSYSTPTFTISYNKGTNGTGTKDNESKTCSVDFTLPGSTFTYDGHSQDGWATSDGGTKAYNLSGSYTTNAAQTFYPHWKCNTPEISCSSGTVTITVPSGAKVYYTTTTDGSEPADPTSSSSEYDPESKPTISEDTKIKAIAIQDGCTSSEIASEDLEYVNTYTVTYTTTGSTSGSAPTDSNSPYTSGSTVTVLGNTGSLVKTGNVFLGWSDGSGNNYAPGETFTISSNTTLSPIWKDGTSATVTYTMAVGGQAWSASGSSNETTGIPNAGVTITTTNAGIDGGNGTGSKTSKLAIKTGANGATYDSPTNYILYNFSVASGYAFTPSDITIQIANVGSSSANNIKYKAVLSDESSHSISTTYICTTGNGTIETFHLYNEEGVAFDGNVSLKLWAWTIEKKENGGSNYRLGTPLTIAGVTESTCSTPADPDGLAVGSITSSGATFTITDDESPASYEIYYSTSSTAPTSGTAASATTTGKTKAVTGLSPSTTYYAWVRAVCNASYKSDWVALTESTFETEAMSLPATLDKSNVTAVSDDTYWSDDNTYYDYGSTDATNTSRYQDWEVNVIPCTYEVSVVMNTSGDGDGTQWGLQLLDAEEKVIASYNSVKAYGETSKTYDTKWDLTKIVEGVYTLRVKNIFSFAQPKLKSLTLDASIYTITYDANGGTCGTESETVCGGGVTLPIPTKAGYACIGWYNSSDVKQGDAGGDYEPDNDITLYAHWAAMPTVSDLEIDYTNATATSIPLSWTIPGKIDLSTASFDDSDPDFFISSQKPANSKSYDSSSEELTVTYTATQWAQTGVALPFAETNLESVTYEYKGHRVFPAVVKSDGSTLYWDYDVVTTADDWTKVTRTPSKIYFNEGTVTPLPTAKAITFCANPNAAKTDESFYIRNVFYHLQGQADVDHVVLMRKEGSAATDTTDASATKLYSGKKSHFTDNTAVAGKAYYYTVFTVHASGVVSTGVSEHLTIYTITYDKGANGAGTIADGKKTGQIDFTLTGTRFTRDHYIQDGWSESDGGAKVYEMSGTYSTDDDITLYPHWVNLDLHQPGVYEKPESLGGYGRPLKLISSHDYEVYFMTQDTVDEANHGALYAGPKDTKISLGKEMFKEAAANTEIKGDGWMAFHMATSICTSEEARIGSAASGSEFFIADGGNSNGAKDSRYAEILSGNYIRFRVSGYDQFSFYGGDYNASYQFIVKIDGITQSYTHNSNNRSIFRFDISTGEHLIEITANGTGSSYCKLRAFSFRLPDVTRYTVSAESNNDSYGAVSASSVTNVRSGSTLYVSSNTFTVNGTTITATPESNTAEYSYAFNNWTIDSSPVTTTATISAATTVTANFTQTANSYSLSWSTDGDDLTGDYTSGTVAYGTSITEPNTPTKTGYTFDAWSPAFTGTMPAANTEYVAQWTINSHTLTWDFDGGSTSDDDYTAGGSVDYNTTLNYPADNTMSKDGYDFNGWSSKPSNMPDEDLTITAQWVPVYRVTYNVMDGDALDPSYADGSSVNTIDLPTPTRTDYTFEGWYTTDGTLVDDDPYTPTADITLYAKWAGSCAGGGGSTTIYAMHMTAHDNYSNDESTTGTSTLVFASDNTVTVSDVVYYKPNSTNAIIVDFSESDYTLQAGDVITFYCVGSDDKSSKTVGFAIKASKDGDAVGTAYVLTAAKTRAAASYTVEAETALVGVNKIWCTRKDGDTRFHDMTITRGGSPCYTVTYHGNGATSGYVNDPAQYTSGANPEVLDCGYTRTGYAFIGWADGTDHRDAGTVDYQPGNHITSISDDVTLYAIWKQIKYFIGAASTTSWNTDGNWSPSGVPAITDPVVIQEDVTVDTDEAQALSVDIESGNTLTINAGQALIIEKTLTKAGGATAATDVIINSTRAAGTGALVIGGETGTNQATVNFETKVKRESGTGNWINQFIGSPFSDLEPYVDYALQIYAFKADGSGNRGYWHSLSEGNKMEEFVGHNILYNDNNFLDVQWTGTLNESSNDLTLTGYYGPNTYSLFANSWVAPIRIGSFESTDFANMDATIYIFNAGTPQQEKEMGAGNGAKTDAGTYAVIPISSGEWIEGTLEVIPAMQAFFVKANAPSPSLTLDYSKLVYTPALTSVGITPTRAPRRATAEEAPEVIRLRVSGENGWAETTYLLGREDFTEGFDNGWDGRYMEGEDTNPQLYAPTGDGNMAVNCVPQIEGTVLGFRKGNADSQYTFSFEYAGEEEYYLKDLKLDIETRIDNESTYAFTAEAGDNAARFIIVRKTPAVATGVDNVDGEGAKVRKLIINDKVYIIRGGRIYSVDGALVK